MDESEIIADLRSIGILAYISPEDLESLKYHGEFGEYGEGEVVVEEGIRQYNLYVIISGSCEIILGKGENEIILSEIGPWDCIGEISILEPGDATATVRVKSTAILWKLDVAQLQRFFEKRPVAAGQLMLGIAQLLCKRMRGANQTILSNKLIPRHLGVRSGKMFEPIRPSKADDKHETGGLFSSIIGKKEKKSGISKSIKR